MRGFVKMKKREEVMLLPLSISPTEFDFELGTSVSGQVSMTQVPFAKEQTCKRTSTDTVVQGFADGVEKSFCMEWQLNPSTGEERDVTIVDEGEHTADGNEDEPRRSMRVYSDLDMDEIADQSPPPAVPSALVSDERELSPEERRARRPVLKLDTKMAALHAFIDPDCALMWSWSPSDKESSEAVMSPHQSSIDKVTDSVAAAKSILDRALKFNAAFEWYNIQLRLCGDSPSPARANALWEEFRKRILHGD